MCGSASRLFPTLTFLLASFPAQSAVYHCQQDGHELYSDRPCSSQARPAQLPPLQTVPAGPAEKGMAEAWDRNTAKTKAARDDADRRWLIDYRARKAREAAIRKGLMEDRVVVGMTPDQVERVLRQTPDQVSGDPRHPKRWVFHNGRARSTTVTFERGRVSKVVYRGPRDE
ncbi:MAG: DUF4124 domain-containing protein [Gammaproteobacteria bacterium]|nr:DUF4124 domain-containing protein [Gammaproteobacteria bacterium]